MFQKLQRPKHNCWSIIEVDCGGIITSSTFNS